MPSSIKPLAILLAIAIAGCASAGVKVTAEQLATLQVGKTTIKDVVERLGPPTMRLVAADGSATFIYSYAQTSTRAATFVPVVGLFAGGADTQASSASLRFAPDGTLLDYTSSDTQIHSGTGVAASSNSTN